MNHVNYFSLLGVDNRCFDHSSSALRCRAFIWILGRLFFMSFSASLQSSTMLKATSNAHATATLLPWPRGTHYTFSITNLFVSKHTKKQEDSKTYVNTARDKFYKLSMQFTSHKEFIITVWMILYPFKKSNFSFIYRMLK